MSGVTHLHHLQARKVNPLREGAKYWRKAVKVPLGGFLDCLFSVVAIQRLLHSQKGFIFVTQF